MLSEPAVDGRVCVLVPVTEPYGGTTKTPKSENPPQLYVTEKSETWIVASAQFSKVKEKVTVAPAVPDVGE